MMLVVAFIGGCVAGALVVLGVLGSHLRSVDRVERARQGLWRKLVAVVLSSGGTVRVPEALPLVCPTWDVDRMELMEYREPVSGDFVFRVREARGTRAPETP